MTPVRCFLMCAALIFCTPAVASAKIDAMFGELSKKVDKYLETASRYDSAAEDSWIPKPFSDTKSSVNKEMNDLLDAALSSLLDDRLLDLKKQITALTQTNNKIQADIADLEMKKLSAPSEKKAFEVWKDSVDDVKQKIEKDKRLIVENKKQIAANKSMIQRLLERSGMNMSMDEIDSLVNTVTGTDTVESMVALKNVHAVINRLQGLMQKDNENIHIAKKYYGLFLMATQAYYHQLEQFKHRIDKEYMPKLDKLRAENKKLMNETKKMADKDATYRNNLQAQQITEEAAKKYEEVLGVQKQRLNERSKQVKTILARAMNTYKTVSIAHNLYDTMSKGMNSYKSLMSLPLIDPIPFKNKALESKFLELTQKLGE